MYIHTREVSKLTPALYSRFYRLNFRERGMMQSVLRDFYNSHVSGKARIFWIEQSGVITSWSLVFSYGRGRGTTAYFYTRQTHRRQGHASKLVKTIEKRYNTVHVHPHDTVSSGFFNTIKTRKVRKVKYY